MLPSPRALLADRRRALFAFLVVGGFAVVMLVRAGPLVPRQITIYAGAEGSSHHTDALAYAAYLSAQGVVATVVETAGSVDSLLRLAADPDASAIALAESGMEQELDPAQLEGLYSLGSVQVAPFWLFVRRDLELGSERDLTGRLVVPGRPGSAIRVVAQALLAENDLPEDIVASPLAEVPAERTLEVLESGQADAAFIIGAPGSPEIDALLSSELVSPVSFTRATAYDRRYDRVLEVVFPRGAFDLGRDIPPTDLRLLASPVQMVAPAGLSSMLVDLMLDAATEVHRDATLFSERGTFPRADGASLPLSPAAKRFYAEGPSPLRRWLPFWLATLVDRFALAAAAILGLMVAVFNILPKLIALRFNMNVGALYRRVEAVEKAHGDKPDRRELIAELDAVTAQARGLKVPRALLPAFFEMRQSIHDVRERVEQLPE